MRLHQRWFRKSRQWAALALTAGLVATTCGSALAATTSPNTSSTGPVVITTESLQTAAVGSPYSVTLAATGGTQPYSWSATPSSLPPGVSLSPAGVLSGTPTTAGTYTIDVQVTAAGPTASQGAPDSYLSGLPGWLQNFIEALLPSPPAPNVAAAALSLTVNPAVAVTTTGLPNAQIGVPYIDLLTATGGSGSGEFVWSLVYGSAYGSLPTGLSLSPTGLITGTPTASQKSTFTVDVADASTPTYTTSATFTLTVVPTLLQIQTGLLPDAFQGTAYSQTLVATGGTPPYRWTSSGLPGWLTLGTDGQLTGTPQAADVGTSGFNVTVTDAGSTAAGAVPAQQTVTIPLTITVHPTSTLTISPSSLPSGQLDQTYSEQLHVTGGNAPYTWSLASGSSLPTGLSLGSSGLISGTPTAQGTFNVQVQVTDNSTPAGSASQTYSLTIGNGALVVSTNQLPAGTLNTPYKTSSNGDVTLEASGGTQPYTWSLSCTNNGSNQTGDACLPAGLSLDTSTGVISGTPNQIQTANFTAKVTDNTGAFATQSLAITINPTQLNLATATLPNAAVNDPYESASGGTVSLAALASGGQSPYTFQLPPCNTSSCPTLPAGLVLKGNGDIVGTPTAAAQGTDSFTVQVVDNHGDSAQQTYQITVAPPLSVTTTSLPGGTQGKGYSQTLSATGGVGPYTWSISGGILPGGLSLSSGGTISGTVSSSAAVQTYTFTVTVTDKENVTATKQLSIAVSKS